MLALLGPSVDSDLFQGVVEAKMEVVFDAPMATNNSNGWCGADDPGYGPSAHPTQANLVIYKGDSDLALHDVDAGRDQAVTGDFRDHTPAISPDGSQITVS
jgi:hypothetical protein